MYINKKENTMELKQTINLLPEMLQPYKQCIIDRGIMAINNTGVIFELTDDTFYIDLIVTDPAHRGKGETKFVMDHLCNQADITKTTLTLVADDTFNTSGFIESRSWRNILYKQASIKKGKLSKKALVAWYERLGFVKQPDSILMVRKPKP